MSTIACAACTAVPPVQEIPPVDSDLQFSLPGIHCAACIATIERGLAGVSGVRDARVNLSLKRLSIKGSISPENVEKAVHDLGYDIYPLDANTLKGSEDLAGKDLLMRLGVAGFAMMNVMLMSVATWSGAEGATRDLFHLVSSIIAVPVVAYSGQPFFKSAAKALRVARLNMDVPISLAILLATGMSVYESVSGGHHAYFDAALSLTFFLLIGRYLDHRSRSAARSAATELAALEVQTSQRVVDGRVETLRTTDLAVGDIVRVAIGARVPVDGQLISDHALLDRSFLTGESRASDADQGEVLQAGSVNLGPPFEIEVTQVAQDSTLRRIADLVATAESGKNSYTALADRAAQIYAPAVHLLALATFLGWWAFTSDIRLAMNIAIAVLIITCPCALGLAVPAVSTTAIGRLFKAGYLVKHATALERLAQVDHAIFDKTGTLTVPHVTLPDTLTPTQKQICVALAQSSEHPIAKALAQQESDIPPAAITDIVEHKGQGLAAMVEGETVKLGNGRWLGASFHGLGFAQGSQPAVALNVDETLRTGARDALDGLTIPAEIVTGDVPDRAERLERELGVPVTALASPEYKHAHIQAETSRGRRVLMVGDGLNDTIALASAHASIAPATALDAARNAADVVLLKEDLSELPLVLAIAQMSTRLSVQNFCIAAAYNCVAIPVAIAGYATPLAAALAMSFSSITVLLNAQRVRFKT
ncbi:heavy metal translocating P-type ATPase [Cognatishimia sp.]|uniref:heavy metal translocating P-type ATPase n=1 Tax=Cognatishimia sp. TaxID=2211648 RepID=UPI003515E5D2